MSFLSPQIEALAKRKKEQSLVKKPDSCGIFSGNMGNWKRFKAPGKANSPLFWA